MKRGLFLVATFTLSSALYAQHVLTPEKAREVFATYNPVLLQKVETDEHLHQLVDQLLRVYTSQNPADTLENRYTLIALARNFENSLALNQTLVQYKQALISSQQGLNIQSAARSHATEALSAIYPRIWAVSIQVKEDLLNHYKQAQRQAKTKTEEARLTRAINALNADLKNLKTDIGPQLVSLTQTALLQAEQQALAEQVSLQTHYPQAAAQASNLQIKTKHKKPVAG